MEIPFFSFVRFLVANRHNIVEKDLIKRFIRVWKSKSIEQFVQYKVSNECKEMSAEQMENKIDLITEDIYIFAMLLTPLNLVMLVGKSKGTFTTFANVITALVKDKLVTISFINNQCICLLRKEWDQVNIIVVVVHNEHFH